MPYDARATNHLSIDSESVLNWNRALPGQWFMGVVDTCLKIVKIAPVNVFDDRGSLSIQALNNASDRAMNRYASGADGERDGISIMPDYMKHRAVGVTHHTAVCQRAGFSVDSSLGFSIIKINNRFALIKSSSTSLNGDKPGIRINHSFSRMTNANKKGFFPTSTMMPIQWEQSIVDYLRRALSIPHICVSND
ncbi:MAG: hypothetical protein PUP46_02025 [Endozoicomonas sp. (ex Botrylloides leachii)]|nr:hypothetical protein [Endozoicomonas sp. (ex Botrylloides leachii)]